MTKEQQNSKRSAKKPQVSLRGETYAMLKAEAEKRGCTITSLVEKILERWETL